MSKCRRHETHLQISATLCVAPIKSNKKNVPHLCGSSLLHKKKREQRSCESWTLSSTSLLERSLLPRFTVVAETIVLIAESFNTIRIPLSFSKVNFIVKGLAIQVAEIVVRQRLKLCDLERSPSM